MSDNKEKLTKNDIRKEIKRESKAYRRKRRLSAFALILVLIAIILVLIFADERGLLGSGTSLGLGDKATDVVNRAAGTIQNINNKMTSKKEQSKAIDDSEEVVKVDEVKGKLDSEETKEVIIDNSTIVVSGAKMLYKDKIYDEASLLKEELLKEEFTSEDVITLKDDKAIRATYEDVKKILNEMEDIQFIEE